MPSGALERLAAALRERGVEAKASEGALYVHGREIATGVVPLSRGRLARGVYRARIPRGRAPGRTRALIVLAHSRRDDVFAAWDVSQRDLSVPRDVVRQAARGEVVVHLYEGKPGVVEGAVTVFPPDLAWTYFEHREEITSAAYGPLAEASERLRHRLAGYGVRVSGPPPAVTHDGGDRGPSEALPPEGPLDSHEESDEGYAGGSTLPDDESGYLVGSDAGGYTDAMPSTGGDIRWAPDPAGEPQRETAERVVNTRFIDHADRTLDRGLPAGERCWFWLDVGPLRADSIEKLPSDVTGVPDGARVTVALFAFPDEIDIEPGADVGELELVAGGSRVISGPRETEGGIAFPVRTPDRRGMVRLRCNLYCERVLVQSRLVTAEVGDRASRPPESVIEYALSRQLRPATLNGLPPTDMSISVNGDDATHQIRFFEGAGAPRKVDATLTTAELENLIEACRTTLRTVAWGRTSEWDVSVKTWNYQSPPSAEVRHRHIVSLATIGYRQFGAIASKIGGVDRTPELMKRLRKPIRIDLAANPSFFIPAAVLYDHPLETGTNVGIRACPAFEEWRTSGAPREESECLCGECPCYGDVQVVCPSGFWGFRHELGWPADDRLEATGTIPAGGHPAVGIGFATDLQLLVEHRDELEALLGTVDVAETRADLFEMLRRRDDEVVYLYCHGGTTPAKAAYFRVGGADEPKVTASELVTLGMDLPDLTTRRPLVFLNGCRTGAVDPRDTFNLVHGFVNEIGAAGVIATEITVFEPMASVFAVHFLRAFMTDGMAVGAAIRHARLELLRDGNPLGLAYVPYVLSGTRRAVA